MSDLKAFKIIKDGKELDYRMGQQIDLAQARAFFATKYIVKSFVMDTRHVTGVIEKDGTEYFLKLSTSEGMSILSENEYKWNDIFNNHFSKNLKFWVPVNKESGYYNGNLFYMVTEKFNGELICPLRKKPSSTQTLEAQIDNIIELSELIQSMTSFEILRPEFQTDLDHQTWFVKKTKSWFEGIPNEVVDQYQVRTLLALVEHGALDLKEKPRHGDFTPWHIMRLDNGKLGLFDGEHAMSKSVENYDICYFIQRVYCILKRPEIAVGIYQKLVDKGYAPEKLQTVLAARAIGGYLDDSLAEKPDYKFAEKFHNWVLSL